jgi:prophage endopeptidase
MLWKTIGDHWRIIAAAMLILMLVITAKIARSNYDRAIAAEHELNLSRATITEMQTRQRDVAALDTKYTKELADAKKQLDDLQLCVSSGKCGLRVNAKCPANGTPSTSGLDDATSPRLTDSAQRDYFTLRERIDYITKQLTGLQQYVREQCLN